MNPATTLTQEEKRVRIAAALGLKDIELRLINEGTGMDAWILSSGVIGNGGFAVPDYFADLNACHEMEKAIVGDLAKLHNDPHIHSLWSAYQARLKWNIHATAAQRAEAFGLTLNLWEEDVQRDPTSDFRPLTSGGAGGEGAS